MTEVIHIVWTAPVSLKQAYELRDKRMDYGVYQVYGRHPVAAIDALLYIGKAVEQTFGERLVQEEWEGWEAGEGPVSVRVGRLSAGATPSNEEWSRQIGIAENLLIVANKPSMNSQGTAWLSPTSDSECREHHILNWGSYGAILPEVSGARWSSKYDTIPGFGAYRWSSPSLPR
jgi:hypothetical protein